MCIHVYIYTHTYETPFVFVVQPKVIWEENLDWPIVYIRLVCGYVHGALSWLWIDARGPSPLWVASSIRWLLWLYRKTAIAWVWASQEAEFLQSFCFRLPLEFPTLFNGRLWPGNVNQIHLLLLLVGRVVCVCVLSQQQTDSKIHPSVFASKWLHFFVLFHKWLQPDTLSNLTNIIAAMNLKCSHW